jgi:hypothetical protein
MLTTVFVLALTACGSGDPDPDQGEDPRSTRETATTVPPAAPADTDPGGTTTADGLDAGLLELCTRLLARAVASAG